MNNNRLPSRLDLGTHIDLSNMISGFIRKVNFREIKYEHQKAHQILNIVENAIENKYEEVSKLIVKARKYKKRIKTEILTKILSLLDDDYCRLDDEVLNKYGYIYYK